MTEIYFLNQIDRLKRRFGERHFDPEFIKLVALEVKGMSEMGLQRAVDVWIGGRTHHKPPLLAEFREARLSEERMRFTRDLDQARVALTQEAERRGLKEVLKEKFGNVKSAWDAVELLTFKARLKEADKSAKADEPKREPPIGTPDRDPDPPAA